MSASRQVFGRMRGPEYSCPARTGPWLLRRGGLGESGIYQQPTGETVRHLIDFVFRFRFGLFCFALTEGRGSVEIWKGNWLNVS